MTEKSDEITQFILDKVDDHPSDLSGLTSARFGISRQAVHKYISRLEKGGILIGTGLTRDRKLMLKTLISKDFEIALAGLEEDRVWRAQVRPALDEVSANILTICQYGFTEMLNNAIDHSEGSKVTVHIERTVKTIRLEIADDGVGIFNKLQRVFTLYDPMHAILELAKGKLTTDPGRHTGEGIFFSSRMFDYFSITSGMLSYIHLEDDVMVEDRLLNIPGTVINMKISTSSSRTTQAIFNEFSDVDDFGFSRTRVPVYLAVYGDENLISRSQARRLMVRFEKFKEIILDFANVTMIGQAFADEVFRVFQLQHPSIKLTPVNALSVVQKMIQHVLNNME